MKISTIIDYIDLGNYALPKFQRGYVWNRDQVRKMMNSLYRGYPIGGLLIWETAVNDDIIRGGTARTAGTVSMILDGQQRMTSLYGIIRGQAPRFFEGNASAFTNLYFNLDEETFEFYMPAKMKDNPVWVNVTQVFKEGQAYVQNRMDATDMSRIQWWFENDRMTKVNRLSGIKDIELPIQIVTGDDKTIDVVVDIFNNVNSGGTKLSKGDLAMAKICAEWSEARDEMKAVLKKYENAGYSFNMDWLLRCITVDLTGQPYFGPLGKLTSTEIKDGLKETDERIGKCLDYIGSRLGLDHAKVLSSVFAIATMVGYIRKKGDRNITSAEWDKLLYWYVHTFLWGRYAGSTESALAQDLRIIEEGGDVEGLIQLLRQSRSSLTLHPQDFWGWSTGARFYPLLYMMTRVCHARDWGTNIELNNMLLGRNSTLEVHHIFPKDVLYHAGVSKSMVNALANYAFLTKATNDAISNKPVDQYMPEFVTQNPAAVKSHWIPMDPELWKLENYDRFLEARRELLAKAANEFLDSLYNGTCVETPIEHFVSRENVHVDVSEDEVIQEVMQWMDENGLPLGLPNFAMIDSNNDTVIIDLAWPDGIQPGLSEPVALLLNEPIETHAKVSQNGYQYFTTAEDFKAYVKSNYLS